MIASEESLEIDFLPPEPASPVEPQSYEFFPLMAALARIPNLDVHYDDWLRIGAALFHTDPNLLQIWIEWSKQSIKYVPGSCEAKWNTFAKYTGTPVTAGTIHHLAKQQKPAPTSRKYFRSDEFEALDLKVNFLIDQFLVEGEAAQIVGGLKTLKTSVAMDAAISLATGKPFLGLYATQQRRIVFMSGESGLCTLRDLYFRIKAQKQTAVDPDYFILSPDIPRFDAKLDDWRKELESLAPQVLFVDPAYLAMDGTEAGNVFVMGQQLKPVADMCRDLGITFVLLHHSTKSSAAEHKPLELTDISWSGFGEFARQTWLLSRREKFKADGVHKLYLQAGGSAWGSTLFRIDVDEGIHPNRKWEVSVRTGDEVETEKRDLEYFAFVSKVLEVLSKGPLQTEELKERVGTSGSRWNLHRDRMAMEGLLAETRQGRSKVYSIKGQA